MLANAEAALGKLTQAPLPAPGRLTFAATLGDAVAGAELIQESVPERLQVKRSVLAAIDAAAPPEAMIGSSTSGLLPCSESLRQRCMVRKKLCPCPANKPCTRTIK